MMALDRDALECDMAETYRIYDLRALPPERVAMLACGLRADSRIKLKQQGLKDFPLSREGAYIADYLKLILKGLLSIDSDDLPWLTDETRAQVHRPEYDGYESGADFMEAWNRMSENARKEGRG